MDQRTAYLPIEDYALIGNCHTAALIFAPLMMIGAIVLGQEALPMPEPAIGLSTIVPVGIVVHMILSMVYGAVFGAFVSSVGFLRDNRWVLIAVAPVFGFALWIVNFYVVVPIAFPWFGMSNPVVQFFAHTFFFGTGGCYARSPRRTSPASTTP